MFTVGIALIAISFLVYPMYLIILLFVPASGIVKVGMIVIAWLFSWIVFGVGSLIAGFQGYESLKKWQR